MRGPGYKLSGDVRRTWRCPKCGFERKLQGDVTTLLCNCNDGTWMQIVAERTMAPRPLQRPSDVERRPIDFGIESPPPAVPKPEATIIKSAISHETEPTHPAVEATSETENPAESIKPAEISNDAEDDWGDGIL